MWVINQGASGYQYCTTKEKETISNPNYLIRFIQDTGKNERYCGIITDYSAYPSRDQKFLITETSGAIWYNAQVNLDHKQSWKYYVYEVADITQIANPALVDYTTLNELEQGRVKVLGTATTIPSFTGYQSTFEEKQ